jgi:hypothetical protein
MATAKAVGNVEKKPRKVKTADDIKADLAAAKQKVADLEQKAYKSELSALIKASHFKADYDAIKSKIPSISDTAMIAEIAKACGALRMQISQAEKKPRVTKPKVNSKKPSAAAKGTAPKP